MLLSGLLAGLLAMPVSAVVTTSVASAQVEPTETKKSKKKRRKRRKKKAKRAAATGGRPAATAATSIGESPAVFDNNRRDEASRILELDPGTGQQTLIYAGDQANPFYSATCGVAQRLDNGNTLVTESDYGRAFEVAPDGTIVWEFYNPFRAGERGRFIATMMEMQRLSPEYSAEWAANLGGDAGGR